MSFFTIQTLFLDFHHIWMLFQRNPVLFLWYYFWYHTSLHMYNVSSVASPVSTSPCRCSYVVMLRYIVDVINPSSCSAPTLFLLIKSFFKILVPISASGLPIPWIEGFHQLFRFPSCLVLWGLILQSSLGTQGTI